MKRLIFALFALVVYVSAAGAQEPTRYGYLDAETWPIEIQRELNAHLSAGAPGLCVLGRVEDDGALRFEGLTTAQETYDCPHPATVALVFFATSAPPDRDTLLRALKSKLDAHPFAAHVAVFWPPAGSGEEPCWCGPKRGHGLTRVARPAQDAPAVPGAQT